MLLKQDTLGKSLYKVLEKWLYDLRKFIIATNEKLNLSDNVNLIVNTYKCLVFQIADENLWYCWTASTMQASQQDSAEMERFWNLQRSKYVNPW